MPVSLDFGYFIGLIFRATVVVNYSNPSTKLRNDTIVVCVNNLKNKLHTATEMAISDSVTVSIGEETKGALRVIFLVSADVKS